jgi:hypothetical protein
VGRGRSDSLSQSVMPLSTMSVTVCDVFMVASVTICDVPIVTSVTVCDVSIVTSVTVCGGGVVGANFCP